MRTLKEYALYKGEKILCIGTIREIAEEMNVRPETIRYYMKPVYKRRLASRKCSGNVRMLVGLD